MRKWLLIGILAAALIGAALIIRNPEPQEPNVTLGQAKVVYEEKADKFERKEISTVESAGENKIEIMKDEPKAVFSKWNDEVRMGVKYGKVKGEGKANGDKIEWKDEKEEVHAYPLPAGEGMEDGGFEIEVVLNEKPDTNKFDFEIDGAEDLDFFYQPELIQEEIVEGAQRPENVVGSYAVYHKTKANHREGSTNYATGKAYHIYRPKAVDADGNEVWATISYDISSLSIIVPQEFLEKATYPVRVDPTFGYTTIGASLGSSATDLYVGSFFPAPENGTVTALNYFQPTDTNDDGPAELGFYNADTSALLTNTTSFTPIANTLNTKAITNQNIVSGTNYAIIYWGEEQALNFDNLGITQGYGVSRAYPGTWDDPLDAPSVNRAYTIYATYTADAPPPAAPPASPMQPIDEQILIFDYPPMKPEEFYKSKLRA